MVEFKTSFTAFMSYFNTEVALFLGTLLIIELSALGIAFLVNHFNRHNQNYKRKQEFLLASLFETVFETVKSTIALTPCFMSMGTEDIGILLFIVKVCTFLYGLYRKTKEISVIISLFLGLFSITLEEKKYCVTTEKELYSYSITQHIFMYRHRITLFQKKSEQKFGD